MGFSRIVLTACGFILVAANAMAAEPAGPAKCVKVVDCAGVAATAAERAEAAASAMRRPASVAVMNGQREFFHIYQNTSGRTLVVTVSASNNASGNTMFGSESLQSDILPGGSKPGSSQATVAAVSFIASGFLSSMTFVVPDKYYYEVSNDGGNITIAYWTEAQL